jgi:TrmH family RNA methyltransferase
MGALFWYPVIQTSFTGFVGWAGLRGYTIYGTSAHAAHDYRSIEGYRLPGILLMGSEREGLTPDQAHACQALLRLPMHGRVTSLNLAVATGVMLYAMLEKIDQAS